MTQSHGSSPLPNDVESGHIVLLGDSIFDNKPYVGSHPAVIDQLKTALPSGWKATLLAVDGSTTDNVPAQCKRLPADATHLIVSVGGNDALVQSRMVDEEVETVSEALLKLAEIGRSFAVDYERMLDIVLARELPTAICTIYDCGFEEWPRQVVLPAALCHFNDVITRAASRRRLPVIDLRTIFTSLPDYANPIEPSPTGGRKMVERMLRWLDGTARDNNALLVG